MKKTISIALSGGAMRGFAHLGVLQRLEELGFFAACVSGTSIGAIVGAFLADGFSAGEIKEIFMGSKFSFEVNYLRLNESILSNKRIEELLNSHLRSKTFEELDRKFFVCVTNYKNGQAEYLHKGELVPAILASAAIPMLYKPVLIKDTVYVDGGVSQNLPVEPLLPFGHPLFGVHVNPLDGDISSLSLLQKIDHLIHLIMRNKVNDAKKYCAVFIEPEQLKRYSLFETKALQTIIDIGYEKAKECLNEELLHRLN